MHTVLKKCYTHQIECNSISASRLQLICPHRPGTFAGHHWQCSEGQTKHQTLHYHHATIHLFHLFHHHHCSCTLNPRALLCSSLLHPLHQNAPYNTVSYFFQIFFTERIFCSAVNLERLKKEMRGLHRILTLNDVGSSVS